MLASLLALKRRAGPLFFAKVCFAYSKLGDGALAKIEFCTTPYWGLKVIFKLAGEPVLALGGGHSFDGVAERGARHSAAVRFEIVA